VDPLANLDEQRRELWQLYEIAIEEYRFQVRLNWDRTKFFFTLNSALVAAAAALIKLGESEISYFYVALLFGTGALTSWMGKKAVQRGHEYYRNTRWKKTVIEDQLGLHKPLDGYQEHTTLAIGTTIGQQEHQKVLHSAVSKGDRLRSGSIISGVVRIFVVFAVADLLGAAVSLYEMGSMALGQDLAHAVLSKFCLALMVN
jgi:hypothetical protein